MTVDAAIISKPADGKPAKLLLIQRKKPSCQVGCMLLRGPILTWKLMSDGNTSNKWGGVY